MEWEALPKAIPAFIVPLLPLISFIKKAELFISSGGSVARISVLWYLCLHRQLNVDEKHFPPNLVKLQLELSHLQDDVNILHNL